MKKVLVIGYVWPEPNSSAAGTHMMSLLNAFKSQNWDVEFATPAQPTEHMVNLNDYGIKITLKVTSKVISHVINAQSKNQEQIALKVVSGQLLEQKHNITKSNKVDILVANQMTLTLGDTSAIWKSHQSDQVDFNVLFEFLSTKPDGEFEFTYELIG